MITGACEYCSREGDRVGGKEDGLESDLFVCDSCMNMLRNPTLGPQLIRGHLTISLRGTKPNKTVKRDINKFMDALVEMRKTYQ